jgi:hypothetical protein
VERATRGATSADNLDASSVEELLRKARDAGALYRALCAVVAAPSLAARELLTLPVAFAIGLPHPFSVVFRRGPQPIVATTSREAYAQAQEIGAVVFVMREIGAAAHAVALERAHPADLDRWIAAKRHGDWRLTPELAAGLATASEDIGRSEVCFGALFDALGAELVDVEVHELAPSQEVA